MSYIKNINQEEILKLADQVSVSEGQIVSKTLAQNPFVSLTLFGFSKGEEISTHKSEGDAMVLVLEGKGKFTIDDKEYLLGEGESIIMPAEKPHAVYGEENFKMMLTVVFSTKKQM